MEQMKIAEMKQIIQKLASHKDDMVKTQVKDMKAIFDKGWNIQMWRIGCNLQQIFCNSSCLVKKL